MHKLNKKQKIILSILAILIALGISYYIYEKDKNEEIITNDNIQETKENTNIENNETKEKLQNENKIIVHVSGSIIKEGIVELNSNSRIADAIEKAGGVKEDADMSKINLAYMLEDGMKIYIPSKNDKEELQEYDQLNNYVQGGSSSLGSGKNLSSNTSSNLKVDKNTNGYSNGNKININKATQTELETLPGIGPSTATKIINYRNKNGKFNKTDDIKNVSGIGDSKYNNIKDFICVK